MEDKEKKVNRPKTTSTLEDLTTMRNIDRALEQEATVSQDMVDDFKNSQEFDNMQMDKAVNPKHYKENIFGKELIEVMLEIFSYAECIAYCKINVFKYRMRAGKKSDSIEQDIKKALWYEDKANELKNKYDDLPF